MLFSNTQVAQFINASFEPVWISVREVPIVRIDFGRGKRLTRTLHGNIATYVCTSKGVTLDIMPGIYEPNTYLDRLSQFVMLHRWFVQKAESPQQKLKQYHDAKLKAAAENGAVQFIVFDVSKVMRIEAPLKMVLAPSNSKMATRSTNPPAGRSTELVTGASHSLWVSLAEDTRINESVRGRMIHEYLAQHGPVRPEDITRWLYKDVLHADLDDPYLGLGETLFATYPFRDQEGR